MAPSPVAPDRKPISPIANSARNPLVLRRAAAAVAPAAPPPSAAALFLKMSRRNAEREPGKLDRHADSRLHVSSRRRTDRPFSKLKNCSNDEPFLFFMLFQANGTSSQFLEYLEKEHFSDSHYQYQKLGIEGERSIAAKILNPHQFKLPLYVAFI